MNKIAANTKYPEISGQLFYNLSSCTPVLWNNPWLKPLVEAGHDEGITYHDMLDAEARLKRFSPLIRALFPETIPDDGIIESGLREIDCIREALQEANRMKIRGRLFLKCDHELPVAGSIKARGGIYEVLKYAEKLVFENHRSAGSGDYSTFTSLKDFFNKYTITTGSTGNLGLSIGAIGAALGFNVVVHMSSDAKEWKKALLRQKGVQIVEHCAEYTAAVAEARKEAASRKDCHFIDDEHSRDLFLGYSVSAFRLKMQMEKMNVRVDGKNPLAVYVPCGVGGAPGGICFGLKQVFGDHVHCFFAEPTHSPCMLLGLATQRFNEICVQDFGLDNITDADGLAVGRPSGLAGRMVKNLVSGIYTVDDMDMYRLLAILMDAEGIYLEPSAALGLLGPVIIMQKSGFLSHADNITHVVWGTGGSMVPYNIKSKHYEKGRLSLCNNFVYESGYS